MPTLVHTLPKFGGGRDTDSIPNSGFDTREDETDRDGAGQ